MTAISLHNFESGQRAVPAITCIGGGTGLATMLRGLKRRTSNITAIVTVSDDGGGSGVLRNDLGMPPPGDIRNCIEALSNVEPVLGKLLAYRFESGYLKGQSFGNLFLAAMNGISGSFDEAVVRMGEVLAITGRVLPVTNGDVRLVAEFEDGGFITGESNISKAKQERGCRIKRIHLEPQRVTALRESMDALRESDMIILGPGSLYTSVIPNLLVEGISETVSGSRALKLYVGNIMTQPGETEGYTIADHISELFSHSRQKLFDCCLMNNAPVPEELLRKYALDGAEPVVADEELSRRLGVNIIQRPLAGGGGDFMRHDPLLLANAVMDIFNERSPTRVY